jgi:hypothetical protein
MIAHKQSALVQLLIVGDDHAAIAGRSQVLAREEVKHPQVPMLPAFLPLYVAVVDWAASSMTWRP